MCCACKIIYWFSVVFCVVRAVHKFDFGLVTKEHRTNGDQYLLKEIHPAVIETHVFDSICIFSPRPSSGVLRDSTHAVQVNAFL
jgi:hypothetical protein